jgi:RHS repeat-associated protein
MMAEGNLVASYNALNQPVAIIPTGSPNIYWFGYDPLGRCVKRWTEALMPDGSVPPSTSNSATAVYLYYDGENLIQETPASGGVLWNGSSLVSASQGATQVYIHGSRVDEIVFSANFATGQFVYHHYDANGNCTLLTDTGGGIAEQYEYDAFGHPYFFNAGGSEFTSSQWNNRFLFTGREYLSELKLYDYRARMYQPELGRFMQPDPKEFDAGDYNLYRYCHW